MLADDSTIFVVSLWAAAGVATSTEQATGVSLVGGALCRGYGALGHWQTQLCLLSFLQVLPPPPAETPYIPKLAK